MSFQDELKLYFDARIAVVNVVTSELARVIRETDGFVGAELEAVVKDALFPAFMDGRRELETEDLVRAAGDMVPLAKSHHERIARLRQLVVNGQARNASKHTMADEVKVEQVRGAR